MIIQCEECQTRFRLADDKIKPDGTKVRCSKCRHVFTVMPPEPEPEPEQSPEPVDFGAFNMEKVTEEEPPASTEEPAAARPSPEPATESDTPSDELDFTGLEQEMEAREDASGELAEDFSFADTSEAAAEEETGDPEARTFDFTETSDSEPGETDFASAFSESKSADADETAWSLGDEEPPWTEQDPGALDFTTEAPEPSDSSAETERTEAPETNVPGEFAFDEEGSDGQAFAFDAETEDDRTFQFDEEETDSRAFSFDEEAAASDLRESEEEPSTFDFGDGGDAFSFDNEPTAGDEPGATTWTEEEKEEGPSFDFDEPQFETEAPPASPSQEEGGLHFGEIDFADDTGTEGPTVSGDDEFAGATLARSEESEAVDRPKPEASRPGSEDRDRREAPLPAPKKAPRKKSPMSRVLLLLVLLLIVLGGAAGYFYLQDGGFDLNRIAQRFPFLQAYLGQPAEVAEAPQIGINITSSTYVNNRNVGQLLVIQGEAVNNYPKARSAITIKGILLDEQGRVLRQQTVFCGNPLSTEKLQTLPFSNIEEAMNNQFGDSLSNMNVAAGAKIPFTVVFRNLPEGIANINIEIVDSKPAGS